VAPAFPRLTQPPEGDDWTMAGCRTNDGRAASLESSGAPRLALDGHCEARRERRHCCCARKAFARV